MIHKTSSYMGKIKRMDQVKTIIATYLDCGSIKSTARRLKISKNTVKDYLRRAEAHNVELSALLLLSQSELLKIFYKAKNASASNKESVFNEKIDDWLKELRRVGVTKYLLWEEYREEHSDGYGYSQFCRRLRQATGRRDLTLSMEHTPGEVMHVPKFSVIITFFRGRKELLFNWRDNWAHITGLICRQHDRASRRIKRVWRIW